MKWNFKFIWFDLWIGIFIDTKKKLIYILPLPMCVFIIDFKVLYVNWKYRKYDDELCCCGEQIGHGGSICYHGGCRSMKEYTITSELETLNKL